MSKKRTLFSALTALAGTWLAYSQMKINHRLPLPRAIEADRETFIGKNTGMVSYYVDRSGSGRPLVLIHSINAAASAYEMRPIFEHYRGKRPVYAIDLPGFGFSDRTKREYSFQLYRDTIIEFLSRIGEASDVIALSLSSEFAARAGVQRPDLFNSLTVISPTGFGNKGASQNASASGTSDFFLGAFSFPLWTQAFYDLIATRASIHYFLQQSFEGNVDYGLEAYAYKTSHQPGARYAPLYFVSGKLFTPNVRKVVYGEVTFPVMVIYDKDNFTGFDALPEFVSQHPNWRAVRITPTRGLPHFEKPGDVIYRLDQFWKETETQTTTS